MDEKDRLVTVELLEPLTMPMGARWAAGERAGFTPADAEDLIRRGIARRAPARPEAHKMVAGDKTATK